MFLLWIFVSFFDFFLCVRMCGLYMRGTSIHMYVWVCVPMLTQMLEEDVQCPTLSYLRESEAVTEPG